MILNKDLHLVPMPRSLETQGDIHKLPDHALIIIDAPDPLKIYFSAQSLQDCLLKLREIFFCSR